jgi:hypothetical protein
MTSFLQIDLDNEAAVHRGYRVLKFLVDGATRTTEDARGLSSEEAQTPHDGVTPRETPAKRTRRTKAEIEAAKAPADPSPVQAATPAPQPVQSTPAPSFEDPPVPSASPSFLDDEPVKVTTKDDVRAALVALQMKRTGVYVQGGKSEKDAAAAAEADARAVIVRIGGTDRLGTLDEKKYGAVVKAANEEAAK